MTVAEPDIHGQTAISALWQKLRMRLDEPLYILSRSKLTVFGLVTVILLILIAILADVLVPYNPVATSPMDALLAPSGEHLFGTDQYGRDVFSRMVYATRIDMFIALTSVGFAFFIGSMIGAISGYYGGLLDTLLMRVVEVLMSFPPFILAMGTASALGAGMANIIYVVALIQCPIYIRLVRGEILSARERPYAEAAKTTGNTGFQIVFLHLLPNCLPPLLVQVAVNLSWAILNSAGLSFIGLGVRQPTPEWGSMIYEGMNFMLSGKWWLFFFPGAAIFITILAFNLLADGFRDVFDPKLRW